LLPAAANRMTKTYTIRLGTADSAAALRRAAEVLRRGGLVAFPTETVYGLGANALDEAAVARIFAAKGRPANNPLIVHVSRTEQARELVTDWPVAAEKLAERFWPGPLTLVLGRRPTVPAIVAAGADTLAGRVPAHPVALALLEAAGLPLAAPSANRSNQISPTTAQHVLESFGAAEGQGEALIEIILDGGPTTGGLESTVVDLTTTPPRLLRPGLISPSQIEIVIGPITRTALSLAAAEQSLPSPGTQPRHYAPRAPMECHATGGRRRVEDLASQGIRTGWLALGESRAVMRPEIVVASMPASATEYAAQLYAALHTLDAAGVERIIVDLPPDEEAWLAIRDRLRRGSAP